MGLPPLGKVDELHGHRRHVSHVEGLGHADRPLDRQPVASPAARASRWSSDRGLRGSVVQACSADSRRRYQLGYEWCGYAPPAVTTMSVANPAASPSRTPQWSSSLRPFLCATPSSWMTT